MLKGYKTHILAGLAVITAIATYLVGDITLADAIQLAVTGLLGSAIRSGIKTEPTKK